MRTRLRRVMVGLFLFFAVFAAWAWLRPYAWGVDDAAGGRIIGCQVEQDRTNYWLSVHLEITDGEDLDLEKPLGLMADGDRLVEPADLTMQQDDEGRVSQVWVKFWLDEEDLNGPLGLQINDGVLMVRTRSGVPPLGGDGSKYFTSNRW